MPNWFARDIEGLRLIGFGLAAGLAAFHRELRVADQFLAIVDVGGAERDADRTRDADFEIGQAERGRQRALNTFRDMVGVAQAVFQRQQDTEFVAAGSRQHVLCAQGSLQAPGDRDEQLVPRHRAEARVHAAEPIEIDDQHRVAGAFRRIVEQTFQPVAKPGAVGQAGQAVGQHFAPQIMFGAQFRGLIDQHQHAALLGIARQARERRLIMPALHRVAIFHLEFRPQRFAVDEVLDARGHLGNQRPAAFART